MLTNRQIGFALIAAGVVLAANFTSGPIIMWFISAGVGLIGLRILASNGSGTRKKQAEHPEIEINDDDVAPRAPQDSGSRTGSRGSREDPRSNDSDWDGDSD